MKQSRQALMKGWDKEKISRASVLVGGCGAIGSITVMKLAKLGVGKIIAVDYDILEEHNVENQMYTKKDIGKSKVLALKEMIRNINEKTIIEPCKYKIEELQTFGNVDYYLSCFDNFAARLYLNRCSIFNSKPMILAGIEDFRGMVMTVIPGKTACLDCWSSLIPEEPEPDPNDPDSCSRKPIPSTFITASHASDLQVMQLINLIFGWKVEPYIYFDLKNNTCISLPLAANPDCICGGGSSG